jgi:hypothetical protein
MQTGPHVVAFPVVAGLVLIAPLVPGDAGQGEDRRGRGFLAPVPRR